MGALVVGVVADEPALQRRHEIPRADFPAVPCFVAREPSSTVRQELDEAFEANVLSGVACTHC